MGDWVVRFSHHWQKLLLPQTPVDTPVPYAPTCRSPPGNVASPLPPPHVKGLTAQKQWKKLYDLLPPFSMLKMPPISSTTLPSYVSLISPPSLNPLGFLLWIPHAHLNPASKNGLITVARNSYHPVCVPGSRQPLNFFALADARKKKRDFTATVFPRFPPSTVPVPKQNVLTAPGSTQDAPTSTIAAPTVIPPPSSLPSTSLASAPSSSHFQMPHTSHTPPFSKGTNNKRPRLPPASTSTGVRTGHPLQFFEQSKRPPVGYAPPPVPRTATSGPYQLGPQKGKAYGKWVTPPPVFAPPAQARPPPPPPPWHHCHLFILPYCVVSLGILFGSPPGSCRYYFLITLNVPPRSS